MMERKGHSFRHVNFVLQCDCTSNVLDCSKQSRIQRSNRTSCSHEEVNGMTLELLAEHGK